MGGLGVYVFGVCCFPRFCVANDLLLEFEETLGLTCCELVHFGGFRCWVVLMFGVLVFVLIDFWWVTWVADLRLFEWIYILEFLILASGALLKFKLPGFGLLF